MKSAKKTRVHFGCSDVIILGFTNVDIRPGKGVDVVTDVTKLDFSPFDKLSDIIKKLQGNIKN